MDTLQYELMAQHEYTHWWFLAKRLFIASQLPKNNPHWNILDLGCGTGGLSKFLENWGDVMRVEQSKIAIQFLHQIHLPHIQQDINKFTKPLRHFNLICIFDVLYHKNISDDEQILKHAYMMLKKNGILLITDSAVPWLYSHHDVENCARERYDLEKFCNKVENAGFIIEKKSYIYFLLFPLFFILRIFGKVFHFKNVSTINPIINSLLYKLCVFESKMLAYTNFPIGSSILIKAKKIN